MKFRKINLNSGDWEFYIGKSNVVLKNSDEKKFVVPYTELKSMTQEEIEEAQAKKGFAITPADIATYIDLKLAAKS